MSVTFKNSNVISSSISILQISLNISVIDSCVKVKPLIVVSKSIVALELNPTIEEIRKSPLKMTLSWYLDNEILSNNLSNM